MFLRLGADANVVIDHLVGCLGQPTSDSGWYTSSFENGVLSCFQPDRERWLGWGRDESSFSVYFADGGVLAFNEPTFVGYWSSGPVDLDGLVPATKEGLSSGVPLSELRAFYPDVESEVTPWGSTFYYLGPSPGLANLRPVGGLMAVVEEGVVVGLGLGASCGE